MPTQRAHLRIAALLTSALALPIASAQAYPDKPITIVVPYPAGGAVDRAGRALGAELGKKLGTTVVIENIGGASGTIGAKRVQRASADGYTLLMGSVNDMVVAPPVLKAGYTSQDFTPITRVTFSTTALVAHPAYPANNVDELISLAKAEKGPLLSGASGAAMMQTIGGTLLANAAGFRMEHVVYKGGAPLLTDLMGAQVQLGTISLTSALPMIREGKLKAIGIISARRDPTAPQIPTVNESRAMRGVEADLWTGLFGPAKLPQPVVTKLSAAVLQIMADTAFRESEFKAGSVVVQANDAKEFARYVQSEEERLKPILSQIKATP